jgi:hypothetical protein
MNKIHFLLLLTVFGCKKIDPAPDEFIDRQFWGEAIAVTDIEFVSKLGGVMKFDLHVVAMKNAATHHLYPDSTFKSVSGFSLGTTITADSITKNEITDNLPFQTIILVDETPSGWSQHNSAVFFDALNRMNKLCKAENNQFFGIGFYARNEYFENSPVYYFKEDVSGSLFEHSEQEILNFICKFYLGLGIPQTSSLFDAINASIDNLISNPLSTNQSITVILANYDDGFSSINYNNLLQKCIDNNIKINLITSDLTSYYLYQLALGTEGFIADVYSSRPAESVVFHAYDLLAKNYKEYILHCSATRVSPWGTGYLFSGYLQAIFSQEINSIYFEEDLYDDFSIDQKLPVSIKVQ